MSDREIEEKEEEKPTDNTVCTIITHVLFTRDFHDS